MKGMQSNMVQNKHIFAICCLACILRAKKKKRKQWTVLYVDTRGAG